RDNERYRYVDLPRNLALPHFRLDFGPFVERVRDRRENCSAFSMEVSHESSSAITPAVTGLAAICRRLHSPNLHACPYARLWSAAHVWAADRRCSAACSGIGQ